MNLLESLPAEVQKDIEEIRSVDVETLAVTSGDSGLIQFLLGDKKAVLVDDIVLCGGCYKGYKVRRFDHQARLRLIDAPADRPASRPQ
jgi:hypothetical protein